MRFVNQPSHFFKCIVVWTKDKNGSSLGCSSSWKLERTCLLENFKWNIIEPPFETTYFLGLLISNTSFGSWFRSDLDHKKQYSTPQRAEIDVTYRNSIFQSHQYWRPRYILYPSSQQEALKVDVRWVKSKVCTRETTIEMNGKREGVHWPLILKTAIIHFDPALIRAFKIRNSYENWLFLHVFGSRNKLSLGTFLEGLYLYLATCQTLNKGGDPHQLWEFKKEDTLQPP